MLPHRLLVGRARFPPDAPPFVSCFVISRLGLLRFCCPDSSSVAPVRARHRSPIVIAFCYRSHWRMDKSVARWRALLRGDTAPHPARFAYISNCHKNLMYNGRLSPFLLACGQNRLILCKQACCIMGYYKPRKQKKESKSPPLF